MRRPTGSLGFSSGSRGFFRHCGARDLYGPAFGGAVSEFNVQLN